MHGGKTLLALALFACLWVPAQAGGDAAAGKAAFAKCAGCHAVGPRARSGFGPHLKGIIGRQAGSATDYRYSDAMRNAGFIWTADRLRAFLHSPGDVVPGNRMRFLGIRNEREIDNLLAYLRSLP